MWKLLAKSAVAKRNKPRARQKETFPVVNVTDGGGEVAQQLRAFPTLPEDPSSVPNTHILGYSCHL